MVLHGGSGLSDDDFRQAVSLGICKVNIFTDIDKAGKAGIEKGLAAGAKTNIFPFTTYYIPFATDLKYVSSACCIIQSSKQTKRSNRRIIKISGGYKNDKGN